ncbi:MAG: hypothetical protein ACI9TB_000153 [Parasphingorhabdus sp.]|jgi:hypothetical protein|uniref:hypothetical protein n=1 Tax=Parasphingorhabdus sp. TaxID=2709688 RepID=UPI002B273CD7|nr:hypothetical protein [Parasphingorhabdus sp.]|tara:strand:- start:2246 stop:2446 length:201 start_codon:yes stop_codon:yes gene_type:complete
MNLIRISLAIGWTAKNRLLNPLRGLVAVMGGALFSFAYLLLRSFGGTQSLHHLLLGRQQGAYDVAN